MNRINIKLKKLFFLIFIIVLRNYNNYIPNNLKDNYDWCIIGGGPAGIIILGILLDLGINPKSIKWIDPSFKVGRIGEFYSNVSANSINISYIEFIESCNTFQKIKSENILNLYNLDPNSYVNLEFIINALQDITDNLKSYVPFSKGYVDYLSFDSKLSTWTIGLNNNLIRSKNVILATGSHPRSLNLENENQEVISIDIALDKNKLKNLVNQNDTISVFGGAHSAILILKYLTEIGVKKIINFYKTPLLYMYIENEKIINTNGLKGIAAKWAQENLENDKINNLIRLYASEENIKNYLYKSNKIIYAAGFERNEITKDGVIIDNNKIEIEFDPLTGKLGPNLFGIGIAFPPKTDDLKEDSIGINSFMKYALKFAPLWIFRLLNNNLNVIKQKIKLEKFSKLINITKL